MKRSTPIPVLAAAVLGGLVATVINSAFGQQMMQPNFAPRVVSITALHRPAPSNLMEVFRVWSDGLTETSTAVTDPGGTIFMGWEIIGE